jgi:hypothetical protein
MQNAIICFDFKNFDPARKMAHQERCGVNDGIEGPAPMPRNGGHQWVQISEVKSHLRPS